MLQILLFYSGTVGLVDVVLTFPWSHVTGEQLISREGEGQTRVRERTGAYVKSHTAVGGARRHNSYKLTKIFKNKTPRLAKGFFYTGANNGDELPTAFNLQVTSPIHTVVSLILAVCWLIVTFPPLIYIYLPACAFDIGNCLELIFAPLS